MDDLSKKIKSLSYSTIEREISRFYGLGMINSSSLPSVLSEDENGVYFIDGTRKSGDFSIKITKQSEGDYSLFVWAYDLKRKR